ncbi:MAG: GGDEF and EAL domain-containing protein [Salana multivorans]|uniref:GGDEF and EAL domain-containing protein n=1 Tax=Salana multivorans TaxID=120377 RepID=UPI001AD18854|nr:GGDEF and EAL domain-containing protein [Salana multivorans]MBN8882102.1 GGDEF and EAL domain-containing protein [Salana multivorans]
MMLPRLSAEYLARTPAVPRRLGDRAVRAWAIAWSCVVLLVLVILWDAASPITYPLWVIVTLLSLTASSALTVAISRVDATLVLSLSPAMLLIGLESVGASKMLAVWGTAYYLGSVLRFRDLGDAAETTAYVFGCAFVTVALWHGLDGRVSWILAVPLCVAAHLATRLLISSVRLLVVTRLSVRGAFGELLLFRATACWAGISLAALAGIALLRLTLAQESVVGRVWAGGFAIFVLGFAAFAIGVLRESRALAAQLAGTLEAALALPWSAGRSVQEHARAYAQLALPRHTVEFHGADGRHINEIVSPLDGGYLVARRGTTKPPFLVQDQRVLDAIAHIADTMAASTRERERLSRAAATDDLTGLPNYRGFREALATVADEACEGFAVVYVDVDRFKEVNDHHGHETGNTVLRTLATRMRARLWGDDLVARLGGDEFVLILADVPDEPTGRRRAEVLLAESSAPVIVGDTVIPLSLSFGLAFAGPDADVTALVETADARMYAARGRQLEGPVAVPGASSGTDVRDLVEAVESAVRERRLFFVYQPIVDCAENRVVALEALVRSDEERLRDLPANLIVHEAARLGLLTELSTHLVDTAVADMVAFQRVVPDLADVHVNIDVEQLTDPAFLAAMRRAEDSPTVRITLELSETSLNRTSAAADRELQRLRGDAGVRIALDDFGRDSSTLVSIVRYPLDVLKLDRTLTLDLVERKPQLVVESIALLTDRLDVEMVAEGVEEDETCELLRAIGVRYMQGYRFGTALPAAAMAERLTTHGLLARLP